MVSKEQLEELKALRAAGVKSIEVHNDGAYFAEFFPTSLLDRVDAFTKQTEEEERSERDTEAPPADREPIPPAMARVLQRGSVS